MSDSLSTRLSLVITKFGDKTKSPLLPHERTVMQAKKIPEKSGKIEPHIKAFITKIKFEIPSTFVKEVAL